MFVTLFTQHVIRMCRIILSCVARTAVQYFSTLSHKRHDKVFWFSVQMLSETFPSLRRNERDMIKTFTGSHIKYPLFLCNFNETEFSRNSLEKYLNVNVHENPSSRRRVVPRGRTDWQRCMAKLIGAFRNIVNAPRKGQCSVKIKIEKFTRILWKLWFVIYEIMYQKSSDLIITLKTPSMWYSKWILLLYPRNPCNYWDNYWKIDQYNYMCSQFMWLSVFWPQHVSRRVQISCGTWEKFDFVIWTYQQNLSIQVWW